MFVDEQLSRQLITGSRGFGFELLHKLFQSGGDESIFISPLSISLALAMTYNGAAGDTQAAMAEALDLAGRSLEEVNTGYSQLLENLLSSDPEVELNIANSLWAREGREFYEDFLQRVRDSYQAECETLDFVGDPQGSVDTINGWVDTNTKGKIPKIVDFLSPDTAMVLLNAIYFKGAWDGKFDPADTENKPFYLLDGSEKLVPMMSRSGAYPVVSGDGFRATRLPYGENRVCMYIFLPNSDSSIHEFMEKLDSALWERYVGELVAMTELPQFSLGEVEMQLPRFKLEYDVELRDALSAMGMGVAFSPGAADFSKMGPPPLWIDRVIHKSFVEVNEEGTEAAAATAVIMLDAAVEEDPFRFVVDRPFFFAIRDDDTGAVLFMGVVTEPM